MRIGFNLLYLRPGKVGGSEVYARELLAAFARRSGNLLTAYCWPNAADSLKRPGVDVVEAASGDFSQRGRLLAENLGLATLLRRHPVDVLFSPANFCAPLLPHGVPQVATIHDLQHVHLPANFSRAQRLFRTLLFALTTRRCRELIAISEFTRQDVSRNLGVPSDRITTILEGVDRAAAPSEAEKGRVRTAWKLPETYFHYPAMLAPHKNHGLLVEALALARQRSGRDLRLIFTGDPTDGLPRLMALAERAGVASFVRHLGFVPRGDVLPILAGARALLFPSSFEGFGLPILEANQCSVPVLASTAASIPEVAGDAAILLPPGAPGPWADAMVQVLDDGLHAKLVSRGLHNVARFSWDRCAEETERVLRRACGGEG
jgi:glycosyltransferase involved in cell wall biosynthesis